MYKRNKKLYHSLSAKLCQEPTPPILIMSVMIKNPLKFLDPDSDLDQCQNLYHQFL